MPSLEAKHAAPILGYRLIERLGAGGFGEVWKAEAPGGLLKAIKFVYGAIADRHASQEVKGFERIKAIRHPFVLSLERVEVVNGQLVIVSELADKTLLERFEECRTAGGIGIPRAELLRHLQDAADALDYMTEQFQLQHLDIKPGNLFLVGGRIKVGDFGLVRDVYNPHRATSGGLSPAYAAPESFTGEVSRYTDQYSLAVVYQEMLTGVRPFRGRTTLQLSDQHLHISPNLAPLPLGDHPVIARALSKNPRDRFPTCTEMVHALLKVEPGGSTGTGTGTDARAGSAWDVASPSWPRGDRPRAIDVPATDPEQGPSPTLPTCPMSVPFPSVAEARAALIQAGASPVHAARPTLFLGIGGIAGRVLRQSKHLFQTRLDSRSSRQPWRRLWLDTDRNAIREASRADAAGALAPDETLLMPIHRTDHYTPHLKEVLRWLDRNWVYRIPRSRCTEGIRPLGRLALIDHADQVLARLRHAIRQFQSDLRPGERQDQLKVVLIAGISGGTGGGCVADVGFALRRILREEGLEGTPVEGVLILASTVRREQRELAKTDAYATLTELHSYFDPSFAFPGEPALGLGPLGPGARLFDTAHLIDFGDIHTDEDIESGAHLVAEYFYLDRATPYGSRRASAPSRPSAPGPAGAPLVKSFRLARLGFPRAELRRVVAVEVCRRMIARWQSDAPRPAITDSALTASNLSGPAAAPCDPPETEADRLYAQLELDDEMFFELVAERVERAFGTDPLKLCRRDAHDILEARSRDEMDKAIGRFFEQMDELIGSGTSPEDDGSADSDQRLHHEFKHDVTNKQHHLEDWLRGIVEDPTRRLKPAMEAVQSFIRRLVEEAEALQSRATAIREQRVEIRARHVGAGSRRPIPVRLISRRSEASAQSVDELREYSQLCIREIAARVRAEILRALRGKASQIAEEFEVIEQGLAGVEHLLEPSHPRYRNSAHVALGISEEVLPLEASRFSEAAGALAESFCSERRLGDLERRFQDEVLKPHGGFVAVMSRGPRLIAELIHTTLVPRVADAVDRWLEDSDAASLLIRRSGSAQAVEDELRNYLKSAAFRFEGPADQRVVVGLPDSPSGRSLREGLERSGALEGADFVTIPEDVVVCLELENLHLPAVAAGLVSDHPVLADLARKLVTRKDVSWTPLPQPD